MSSCSKKKGNLMYIRSTATENFDLAEKKLKSLVLVHQFDSIIHLLKEEEAEGNSWFSPDHQNLLMVNPSKQSIQHQPKPLWKTCCNNTGNISIFYYFLSLEKNIPRIQNHWVVKRNKVIYLIFCYKYPQVTRWSQTEFIILSHTRWYRSKFTQPSSNPVVLFKVVG